MVAVVVVVHGWKQNVVALKKKQQLRDAWQAKAWPQGPSMQLSPRSGHCKLTRSARQAFTRKGGIRF